MAEKGSNKDRSIAQEDYVAMSLGGRRTKASGASQHDLGDVVTNTQIIECKCVGQPGVPVKSKPKILKDLEKVAIEAWQNRKDPAVAMRYFQPDSPLAKPDGWVDIIVRLLEDDQYGH